MTSYLENYHGKLVPDEASFYKVALAVEKLKPTQHRRPFRTSELCAFAQADVFSRPPNVQFSVRVMEAPLVSHDYPPALNYGDFGLLFAHKWVHAL